MLVPALSHLEGEQQEIDFEFNLLEDTPETVAEEMSDCLDLSKASETPIADLIRVEGSSLNVTKPVLIEHCSG